MDHDPPSRTIIVRDGSVIIVRPIEPGDRVLLEAAFAELSDESRYRRFLSPMPRLTAAQLEYLTDVDHHDHEALVALEPDGERLIGVARFVRTQPAIAEPAVAVADEWQRRGVGTALLEVLVDRAIEEGITTFSGYVLFDKPAPLSLLGQVGDVSVRSSGGASQVEVLLLNEDATAPAPGALRTLLRALAASTLEPGLGFWQRLLPPARGQVGDERRNVIVAAVAEGDRTLAGELAAASAATLVLVANPQTPSGRPVSPRSWSGRRSRPGRRSSAAS
jgi:GNAT superfamily N-acetyltransferase